jgi:hypothetical protein
MSVETAGAIVEHTNRQGMPVYAHTESLIHAYGDPQKIEFLDFLIGAAQSVGPDFSGPPMDPPPLEFQLQIRTGSTMSSPPRG